MASSKSNTVNDIPRDKISEAIKSHAEVRLRVTRRNNRGQLATCASNYLMATSDLLTIDEWLGREGGGGQYAVEATDPADPARMVVPRFTVTIEGPEQQWGGRGAAPAPPYGQAPLQAGLPPMPYGYTPPNYGPQQSRWEREQARRDDPRRYMTQTPDQIAMNQVADLQHQLAEEKRAHEADRRRNESQLETINRTLEKTREDRVQEEKRWQEKIWEDRFASLQQKPSGGWDAGSIAAMATAAAPVVQALISSTTERAAQAIQAQTATSQQNTTLMQAIVTKPTGNADWLTGLTKLVPLLSPFVMRFMEANSPKERADLLNVMGEQILTQTSMAAQMIQMQAEATSGDPAWLGIVKEMAQGAERIAQAYQDRNMPPPPLNAQVVTAPPQGTQLGQAPQVPPGMPEPARMAPPPTTATPEQQVDHVMTRLPPHLQTPEWANVVYYLLLNAEANVSGIAESVAGHIENMTRLRTLPEPLWGIPDDPSKIAPLFFDLIPCNDEYRAKCISATMGELAGAVEAVVTPAPAETPTNGSGSRPQPTGMVEPPVEARVVSPADPPAPPAETH